MEPFHFARGVDDYPRPTRLGLRISSSLSLVVPCSLSNLQPSRGALVAVPRLVPLNERRHPRSALGCRRFALGAWIRKPRIPHQAHSSPTGTPQPTQFRLGKRVEVPKGCGVHAVAPHDEGRAVSIAGSHS